MPVAFKTRKFRIIAHARSERTRRLDKQGAESLVKWSVERVI